MEIENKLDEDFLFYLGFIRSAIEKFKTNEKEYNICQAWLQKLCGESITSVEEKRNRNILLSHLLLCMEEVKLTEPFINPPQDKLPKAIDIFGKQTATLDEPKWVADVVAGGGDDETTGVIDARTYIATKALPDGKGALGYIAVSLDDGSAAMWTTAGILDKHMAEKYEEMVPAISEIERILINRRNPAERQRVINFYKAITISVGKEIDGLVPPNSNPRIASLMAQLVANLQKKGEYGPYEAMSEKDRHMELLFLLDSRLQERINHVQHREQFLDDIEKTTMNESFFETSLLPEDVHKEVRTSYAGKMWTQAINAGPTHKLIHELTGKYPPFVIKKFLELIADAKEQIALKVQRRHENVFSQLKKELRKEDARGKKKYEKTKLSHDEIVEVAQAIKNAENRAYESYKQRQEHLTGHRKERDEMYEQVRNAMNETQQHVEEEAALGRYLTDQINTLTAQSDVYQHVNEESIQKIEDVNIATMKNIQRLNKAIRQHEQRISTMKDILQRSSTLESGAQFFHI